MQALAQQGYILATGKRPYVLVDIYGQMNALPKLIDDKSVRAKDIRAFLEKDFPPESLPTIEEARKLAAEHRKSFDVHRDHEQKAEAIAHLKNAQAQRRQKVEGQQIVLRQAQHQQRVALAKEQRAARDTQRGAYLVQVKVIKAERIESWPKGLAAFLGRFSGVALIRKKLHQYQDRRRYQAYQHERDRRRERQDQQRRDLHRRHQMQGLELARKVRALDHIDKRELKSLEESLRAEQRIQARGGRDQMPALNLDLKPRGRKAVPHKAKDRHRSAFAQEMAQAGKKRIDAGKKVDLTVEFERAAGNGTTEGKAQGSSDGPKPVARSRSNRNKQQQRRDRDKDRGR